MKNIFTAKILLCLALIIIILTAFIKINNEKPIVKNRADGDYLRICNINQFGGFVLGTLGAIDKYFTDRYQVKYVENNCDITISGPYGKKGLSLSLNQSKFGIPENRAYRA
jgi:hypothetical protein